MTGAPEDAGQAEGSTPPPRRRRRRRVVLLAAGAAAVVLIAGGVTSVVTASHGSAPASAAVSSREAAHRARPAPLRVVSVTPAHAATGVNGADPVEIAFSAPLAADSPLPAIEPAVNGTWAQAKGNREVFTPATAFRPDATFTVTVPSGVHGVRSAAGGQLGAPVKVRFHTGRYSTLRLQQLLAQLGYLPLTWTPSGSGPAAGDTAAQYSAAFSPPAGTFTWQSGYPSMLHSMWRSGANNVIDVGAIRAFESVEGLTMDGVAGRTVWRDLIRAVAKGQHNPNGYTYAYASKGSPETLTIWHDGRVVLHTYANTGIPAAPTADGTYPVYERLPFQIMKGTNPDGSHYADPVQNVAYFNGGDAVHYFSRGSYGWPQSLGCVELPLPESAVAYRYLSYGSLVTVE